MIRAAIGLASICAVALASGQISAGKNRGRPTFTMSISLTRTVFAPGSEIIVDVELTNISSKEIEVVRVNIGPTLYKFKVIDGSGNAAPLTPLGDAIFNGKACYKAKNGETRCFAGNTTYARIASGRRVYEGFDLALYFDLAHPSRYTVRLERTDPNANRTVASNTVAFTVASPD